MKLNFGGRPSFLKERVDKPIVFERSQLEKFVENCRKESISLALGIRILVDRYLQEKDLEAERQNINPIGLPYQQTDNISLVPTAAEEKTQQELTVDEYIEVVKKIPKENLTLEEVSKLEAVFTTKVNEMKQKYYAMKRGAVRDKLSRNKPVEIDIK